MLKKTNIEQMRIACRQALENSRKILLPMAHEYWLTITFRNFAYRIVDREIGTAIKSATTRNQVVEDFLANDLKESFERISFWTKALGILILLSLGVIMYIVWGVYSDEKKLNQRYEEKKRR
jgi:hypothetical protein